MRPAFATRIVGDAVADLNFGARLLRRNPLAVAITVGGLGLAIGVGTSVFTVLNAVALRPIGIAQPASAVRVLRMFEGGMATSWPFSEFAQVRDAASDVSLEARLDERVVFSTASATQSEEAVPVLFVSGGFLRLLNDRVAAGRLLSSRDDVIGASAVVVLSHGFWSMRLGGDSGIIGRSIWLNGTPFTVIGIAARGFSGTTGTAPAMWVPFAQYHAALGGPPIDRASVTMVHVVGRLRAGVTLPQAEASTTATASGVGRTSLARPGEPLTGVRFQPATSRVMPGEAALIALVVVIAVVAIGALVLLACVNVANLLLASAIARQREIGMRLALGASRGRIVRQLLTESLGFGVAAGLIGLLFSVWLVPLLATMVNAPTIEIAPDWRVYLFLATVSVLAGVGAGLSPARQAARVDLLSPMKGAGAYAAGTARPQRLRASLVGVQAMASVVLLVLAALLTRGMIRATQVGVGFDAAHLLTVSPALGWRGQDATTAALYWGHALDNVRAMPGVDAASLTNDPPFGDGSSVMVFTRNGRRYTVYRVTTQPDYFATIGLRVVRGRTYSEQEARTGAPVAVISETIARDFFAGEDPVGQTLDRIQGSGQPGTVVVGVAANAITARLRELGAATVYQPMASMLTAKLLLRTSASPEALIPSVRSALHRVDPRITVEITAVSHDVERQLAESRTLAGLATTLAVIAVALALVGLYGVTTFVVAQRRHEIGLRMACGATSREVTRLMLRDSLRPVIAGLAAGLIVAAGAGRVFAGALYGMSAADPIAFAGAVLLLLAAAVGAVIVPAQRAAAVDPAVVLREL